MLQMTAWGGGFRRIKQPAPPHPCSAPAFVEAQMKLTTGAPQRYAPYPPQRARHGRIAHGPLPAGVPQPQQSWSAEYARPAHGGSLQFWHHLPVEFIGVLARHGISGYDDVSHAPETTRSRIRADPASGPYVAILEALFEAPPDVFTVLRLALSGTAPRRHIHLESVLPHPEQFAPRRGGQTPSCNIQLLRNARMQGLDIRVACDRVADSRASSSVQDSSSYTYDSHLRQIHRVCRVLGEEAFPASLETIRRVSSVVGHPSTLRGWLAAWRRMHHASRLPWPADRDPFLAAVQAGLRRRLGPAPARARCRRSLLRRILRRAAASESWAVGAFAVLAYTFGLRVPSELVAQASSASFHISQNRISYGPIRRKGQSEMQTLQRWCCCEQDPLLCPHDWVRIMCERSPEGRLFQHAAAHYMASVQSLLRDLEVPGAETYTSHCFRRGAAVDVLERHGLQAMLRFGQWRSPGAATPYASQDEQTAIGLAITEASDGEV